MSNLETKFNVLKPCLASSSESQDYENSIPYKDGMINALKNQNRELYETDKRRNEAFKKEIEMYVHQIEYLKNKCYSLELMLQSHVDQK